ncbi:MAG: hypothetical protein KC708_08795 [Anaerolineae bacterium]|nr:hypothetical protein [Anaerolineae bacterium]
MGRVIIDITMSVDGFVTGPNDGPDNGLGDGGRILHDWVFKGTDADKPFLMGEGYDIGAGILGRRTFDIANEAWGDNPPMQGTVFVLTHRPHETSSVARRLLFSSPMAQRPLWRSPAMKPQARTSC